MDLDSIVGVFGGIPLDWIIIGAVVIAVALYVLRSGAQMICTLALALPTTALLLSALSNAAIVGPLSKQFETSPLRALLFVAILIVSYTLVHRMGISYGSESRQPIQAILAGAAAAALLVVIWIQEPALQSIWQFGGDVQSIFGEAYRFWWIIGSYATLAFVRR